MPIDRKMTSDEFTAELWSRVVSRINIMSATGDDVHRAISEVADEIALEIRAYWAGLELEARRELGEKLN